MDSPNSAPKLSPTADQLLRQAAAAEPGWSIPHGGPQGVIALCAQAQDELRRTSEQVAELRVAAIRELLKTHSGADVAKMLGVGKSAISKTRYSIAWENPTW